MEKTAVAVSVITVVLVCLAGAVGAGDFYQLTADGQTFDAYFEEHGGASWLLIGRGREGWEFDTDGQGNVADVCQNLRTTAAFVPACYSDVIVNDLLTQAGMSMGSVTMRLSRASTTDGTGEYQDVRWRDFTGNADAFTWNIEDSQYGVTVERVNAPVGLTGAETGVNTGGNTRDYSPAGNDADRVFTWAWGGHGNLRGFSYGQSQHGVDNNDANTFIWELATEAHAIPYTEVYIVYEAPAGGRIVFSGRGVSNLTATSVWAYATVNTNVSDAVLVWDTADRGDTDTNAWANAVSLGSNGAGVVTGSATGLQADTSYIWRFYGTNATTNGWSAAETLVTPLTAAQTPVFTSAVGVATTITLGWQDNASNETAYVLRRSSAGSGGPYTVIATLDPDTTSYMDGASPSTTYHYQLAATNSANGSGTDFAACQASATTEEAGEVAYEPFDYTPVQANIHGQDGGFGFDGPWVSTISHGRIYWMVEPGLEFTDDNSSALPVAGSALSRFGSAGRAEAHRLLSEESLSFLTGEGTTMWFSALFRSPSAHRYAAVLFGTDGFTTGGSPTLSVAGDGFGFTLSTVALGSGDGTINALAFDNSTSPTVVAGTFRQTLQGGATHHDMSLVVGKINWKPDGTPDELFLFNVTDLSVEPEEGDAMVSITNLDLDQSSFDTVAAWDTNNAITDELRFGTSFEAVVGRGDAPEPPVEGMVLMVK